MKKRGLYNYLSILFSLSHISVSNVKVLKASNKKTGKPCKILISTSKSHQLAGFVNAGSWPANFWNSLKVESALKIWLIFLSLIDY